MQNQHFYKQIGAVSEPVLTVSHVTTVYTVILYCSEELHGAQAIATLLLRTVTTRAGQEKNTTNFNIIYNSS